MDCNFSEHLQRPETTIRIEAKGILQRDSFRYLGSIISKDGEVDEDVKHRIKMRLLNWRLAYVVLCDQQMPTRLKGKFYRTVIRPTMTYGVDSWTIKKKHMHKMGVVEMKILRWMCSKLGWIKLEMSDFMSI